MNGNRQKLKYNPRFVRAEFRRAVCRELALPSGRPSGYELYPVDEKDVEIVNETYSAPNTATLKQCGAENVHEWMLWVAGRIKYGATYLSGKKQSFFLPEYKYNPIEKKDDLEELEIRMENMMDNRMEEVIDRLEPRRKPEVFDYKKMLVEGLTSNETVV